MPQLTFEEFRKANLARKKQFFKDSPVDNWSISDCLMAALGELGEIANALKKVRRAELGMLNKNEEGRQIDSLEDAKAKVAGEIGGFMCYLDQLADMIGLRLENCIVDEFNKKSEELGLPELIINGIFILTTPPRVCHICGGRPPEYASMASIVHQIYCPNSKTETFATSEREVGKHPEQSMENKMETQKAEFDALDQLIKFYRNIPPIVDDDYPEWRHRYEGAAQDLLRAFKNNGRK